MALAGTRARHRTFRWQLLGAVLFLAACGGKSESASSGGSGGNGAGDATGGSATTTGGSSTTSTGGTAGDVTSSTGGDSTTSTGGDSTTSTGGTGGDTTSSTGGTDIGGTGGTGGMPLDCKGVVCAPIPASCKQIVQPPGACCPTCPDTGCEPCPDLVCGPGTHAETTPGDCCPTCQTDPPDACTMGQAQYDAERTALMEKYGSSGCANSADCGLAIEQNACASSCGVALPVNTINDFENNTSNAGSLCSTCPPLPRPQCPAVAPACVNGQCMLEHPTTK